MFYYKKYISNIPRCNRFIAYEEIYSKHHICIYKANISYTGLLTPTKSSYKHRGIVYRYIAKFFILFYQSFSQNKIIMPPLPISCYCINLYSRAVLFRVLVVYNRCRFICLKSYSAPKNSQRIHMSRI